MDWFYAEKDTRKGPVSDRDIAGLIAARKIDPDTLVWNQTMPDWKPAGVTSLFAAPTQSPPPTPVPPGHHLCIITGKFFPESQMLKTEHGWVSIEGKDRYYQSIREGAPIPLADGQSNARADGTKIVIPMLGGRLPMRCVKTNGAVSENELRRKPLYWCNPAVYLGLLVNILVVIVLYYVLRKKIMVDVPLSPAGKRQVTKAKIIATVVFLCGLAVAIFGISLAVDYSINYGPFVIVTGFLIILGGIIYGSRKASVLRVTKVRNGNAWLAGASKEYVASLPSYP